MQSDFLDVAKNFTIIASWAFDPTKSPFLYLCHYYDKDTKSYSPGKEKIRRLVSPYEDKL